MEELKFNKIKLKELKEQLDYKKVSFNKEIANFLLREFLKINFDNVDLESTIKIKDIEFLSFSLKSKKNNINFRIELFDTVLEMHVSNAGYPIYDQYSIKGNEEKIITNLIKWISCDIEKQTLYSNNKLKKEIFYAISFQKKEIIHKSTYLNRFFSRATDKKTINFDKWV